MSSPGPDSGPGLVLAVRQGVLSPGLRRDLTDLNGQFLDLGTAAGAEGDPRCAWSDAVRQCLQEAGPATRAVIAAAPFALFELVLPPGVGRPPEDRVEDARRAGAPALSQTRWSSFAHQVTFLAWRLADGSPLAARVALGLSPAAQAQLGALSLSQVAQLAGQPGLIRARWPAHLRYWQMLTGAARRSSATALQWAHCAGLCLLGAEGAPSPAPPRTAGECRRPRA